MRWMNFYLIIAGTKPWHDKIVARRIPENKDKPSKLKKVIRQSHAFKCSIKWDNLLKITFLKKIMAIKFYLCLKPFTNDLHSLTISVLQMDNEAIVNMPLLFPNKVVGVDWLGNLTNYKEDYNVFIVSCYVHGYS